MIVLGIDPGQSTGLAIFKDGRLASLETLVPVDVPARIASLAQSADMVVFEDSRLQSHTWTRGNSIAATAKMARNVGQVDMLCSIIVAACHQHAIRVHGVSPAGKGAKLADGPFKAVTGWAYRSNQHERDAAMVAWPYRTARAA